MDKWLCNLFYLFYKINFRESAHAAHVEVRGQYAGVTSLFLPHGSGGFNSDTLLPTEHPISLATETSYIPITSTHGLPFSHILFSPAFILFTFCSTIFMVVGTKITGI